MLSLRRAFIVFAVFVGTGASLIGSAMAAQLAGDDKMEVVTLFLSYIGAFAILFALACWLFLRWFKAHYGPDNINPIDLLMLEKMKKDATAGPLLERLDKQDQNIAKLVQIVMDVKSGQDEPMGSGEHYVRFKD